MSGTRTEHDSMGPVKVPAQALYGAQTQRAVNNFTISSRPVRPEFIKATLLIKKFAARANVRLGLLTTEKGSAIERSCDTLLKDFDPADFPVPVFQTGSGTSTNMNVNEVIATLSSREGLTVHPNDDVNLGQSSNDVIPSSMLVATAIAIERSLLPAMDTLHKSILEKSATLSTIVKTGRTHLMDALPIKLSAEFETWALQIQESSTRIRDGLSRLVVLPLGGTAVGSGVNCHPEFAKLAITELGQVTGIPFLSSELPYKGLSSLDTPLEMSGHFRTAATVLMKIANDLRWMNSGPFAGLAEITLPPLQPGSSIMPAKVNPVIPEATCMAAAQVTGLDCANTVAAQSSTFQLNTMFPLIADNLLESCALLSGSCTTLAEKVFANLTVNEEQCRKPLSLNPILVTALVPEIGYEKAAEIGKTAIKTQRTVLEVARELTDIEDSRLQELLDPVRLATGYV